LEIENWRLKVISRGKNGKKLRVKSFGLRVFLSGTRNTEPETALFSPTQLLKIALRSVKTRRKSLVSNKVYLQMGKTVYITAETRRSAEMHREERLKVNFCMRKDKTREKGIYV
jgi:hypothetical protein